jgi:hypothetical protein
MMDVIAQKGWAELFDVTTLTWTEVSDLMPLNDETYWAKPLTLHIHNTKFK